MTWWLGSAGALVLLVAGFFVYVRWIQPWRALEQLLGSVARGTRPPTFLIDGARSVRRVSVALEELLLRQEELDRQVVQDAAEMRAVFTAMKDGLLVVDADRRIALLNPAFQKAFVQQDTPIGSPLLAGVRDAEITEAVAIALETGAAQAREVTALDRRTHFELTAVPISDASGKVSGVVSIFHDITRLKQADEIRRDFVANVSHELRTPLSIFRGNLETLLDSEEIDPEESRHIHETMKRHSDRLNLLINDLLSLARLESKEPVLQLAPVDLAHFLDQVAGDWSKRLARKKLRLDVRVAKDLPPLHADELRLEEIVHNLLDNAIKYSPEASRIAVRASASNGEIELAVTDEGIGISADDLPRIFERFFRVDRARSRDLGGTGLGLSIVKHIAQLHHGRVEAESTPGVGTTIRVRFPSAMSAS